MKVTSAKLNSANVQYNNSVDTERVYNIKGDVNIDNMSVTSINNGYVESNDIQIAVFSWYGQNHLNITYMGVDLSVQCSINTAVNEFITNVLNEITINPINI